MSSTLPEAFTPLVLPRPAPAAVLACGAWLKNRAVLLQHDQAWLSPVHGDLSAPEACAALERSLERLLTAADGPLHAVAHDLHPDFYSTRLAQGLAHRLGVPAVAVQHHQAHVAVVQAEHGFTSEPLVGWALDGVGLGEDGQAWGGELLALHSGQARRLNHLVPLRLPGGDAAAREPWRLAAAVLWASGRGAEAVERFGAQLGTDKVRGILRMLERDLNCPSSSAAGRWFDAAAGMLGLNLQQAHEAEAAQALEAAATAWCAQGQVLPPEDHDVTTAALERLDLHPMVDALADEPDAARGAGRFQGVLAQALVRAGVDAAQAEGVRHIALTGGCCFNRLLMADLSAGFGQAGLDVLRPAAVSPGDAGLALGQAWAAALRVASV